MKLHVEVTQEDIDLGCRMDTTGAKGGCMVFRAVQRRFEGAFDGWIGYSNIHFYDRAKNEIEVPLPIAVSAAIVAFDGKGHVEPFAFDLELPDELLTESRI